MSFDLNNSTSYFNKKFVPFKDASISIASSAVLYGLGVYTVNCLFVNQKTSKKYLFRLSDHYKILL
mgnify:CR=1 FL=1